MAKCNQLTLMPFKGLTLGRFSIQRSPQIIRTLAEQAIYRLDSYIWLRCSSPLSTVCGAEYPPK